VLGAPENGGGGLDERVTALATWVDEIADRVRATELANGDEKTAKELRRAVEMVAKHDPKVESRLTNRIDVVADRLGTLASAVSTTSAELARRDGELAVLRREVEQGNARIRDLGGDLGRAASTADVERLDQAIASLSAVRPSHPTGDQTDRSPERSTTSPNASTPSRRPWLRRPRGWPVAKASLPPSARGSMSVRGTSSRRWRSCE